jgi:hypothetical protein
MSSLWPGRLVVKQDESGVCYHDLDGTRLERFQQLEVLLPTRKWLRISYDWDQPADDTSYDPKCPPLAVLWLGGAWEDTTAHHVRHNIPLVDFYLPADATLRVARNRKLRERTRARMQHSGWNPLPPPRPHPDLVGTLFALCPCGEGFFIAKPDLETSCDKECGRRTRLLRHEPSSAEAPNSVSRVEAEWLEGPEYDQGERHAYLRA